MRTLTAAVVAAVAMLASSAMAEDAPRDARFDELRDAGTSDAEVGGSEVGGSEVGGTDLGLTEVGGPDVGEPSDTSEGDAGGSVDAVPNAELIGRPADLTVAVTVHHRVDRDVSVAVTFAGPVMFAAERIGSGDVMAAGLPLGDYSVTVDAVGFDVEEQVVPLRAPTAIGVELYPAFDVEVVGSVHDSFAQPIVGAEVRLTGSRIDLPAVGVTTESGFRLSVPAGIYDVEVDGPGAARVRRSSVDLLADTELRFLLPDRQEIPDAAEVRRGACAASSARSLPSAALWMMAISAAVLVARRRR